jgi:SAM-dependent methyltransferase
MNIDAWMNINIRREAAYIKRKLLYALQAHKKVVMCPICGWTGEAFHDYDCGYGNIYANAECPVCKSHPRHRLAYLFIYQRLTPRVNTRVLHFAPEESLSRYILANRPTIYVSTDINAKPPMRRENIEHLTFPDESFDVVLCLCVLEHVRNDVKAILELHRVTAKGGVCVIDVPIDYSLKQTYSDPSIKIPQERAKAYWQEDHLRLYGVDFPNKLRTAGFKVQMVYGAGMVGKRKAKQYGLPDFPLHLAYK